MARRSRSRFFFIVVVVAVVVFVVVPVAVAVEQPLSVFPRPPRPARVGDLLRVRSAGPSYFFLLSS